MQSSWLRNWKLGHDYRQASTQRPTQLNSTRLSVFIFQFFYLILVSRRELVANLIHTVRCRRRVESRRVDVDNVYWALD